MWVIYKIKVGPNTVNRYLGKAKLLNVRISQKNRQAFKNKTLKQRQKVKPPLAVKDYKPGALMEKDMKYVLKPGRFVNFEKHKAKENFYYQHTEICSFTRIRLLELVRNAESQTAAQAHQKALKRLPFPVACVNTDSGSENGQSFAENLTKDQVVHFFSRTGTPTDNPRVERSHLTDDLEFYQQGNVYPSFKEQQTALQTWEKTYNYERPPPGAWLPYSHGILQALEEKPPRSPRY